MLDCVHGLPQEPVNSLKIRVWLIHLSLAPDMVLVPGIYCMSNLTELWYVELRECLSSTFSRSPRSYYVVSKITEHFLTPRPQTENMEDPPQGTWTDWWGPRPIIYTSSSAPLFPPLNQRKHQHLSKIK